MRSFFDSRGLLLTAWGLVILLLAGGLTLAFMQPLPAPPRPEPVTVAVAALPPPAQEPAAEEIGAEEPSSAEGDTQAQSDSAESAPEGAAPAETAETATAPEEPGEPEESVTVGIGAAPAAPEEATGEEATPEEATPEEATPEEATPEEATPEEATAEMPETEAAAGEATETEAAGASVTATLPEAAPETPAESAPSESTQSAEEAEAAPESPAGESVAAAPPAPEAAPEGEVQEPPEEDAATGEETEEGQQVAIPLIPPAPEELPYWERYRQPFNLEDPRPRIAVVLTGLGLSDSATEAAINNLPPSITLSFSPYARDLERWIALARARGHEVMLDLPMEPATFPNEDPGPQGLLTRLPSEENLDRLDWVLSRGSAYVGVAGAMGSRFTASRSAMEPILRDVKARGLIFLDPFTTENSVVASLAREIGLHAAVNDRSVDERQASRVSIDARLAQVERIAITEGFAVAMAQPYPVTLERLSEWATELTDRGIAIAPISALVDQQKRP